MKAWFLRSLVLFLVLIAGASYSQNEGAVPDRTGGILRWPLSADPQMWPFTSVSVVNSNVVNHQLFSQLVRYDPSDLAPAPQLATAWEVSDDASVWVFHLRDDVLWHDGTPFSAEDVAFTMLALADPNVLAYHTASFSNLEAVDILDPHTVRLSFSEPVASLLELLAFNVFMAPKHILDGTDLNDPSAFLRSPVGTGPFRFRSFNPGDRIVLEANLDYFEGPPQLDEINLLIVPGQGPQIARFLAGELDLIEVAADLLGSVASRPGVQVFNVPRVQHSFISLNNENPLFADRRVRQALALGYDREAAIIASYGGEADLAAGPIASALAWVYPEEVTPWPYDPERARELLAEAGWADANGDGILDKDGVPFRFQLQFWPGYAQEQLVLVASAGWRQIGIDAQVISYEVNTAIDNVRSRNYEASVYWYVTPSDPDLTSYYASFGTSNVYNYANPAIDRLFAEARATGDVERRRGLYAEVQATLKEDQPVVFIAFPREILVLQSQVVNWPGSDWRNALSVLWQVGLTR